MESTALRARTVRVTGLIATIVAALAGPVRAQATYEFNDAHFHLTNYIQEGPDVRRFLELMGTRVERAARQPDRAREAARA